MAGTKPRARRDPLYEQQCLVLDAGGDIPRLHEVLRAIDWAVSSDPYAFPAVDDEGTRIAFTDAYPGAPELRAFYTIDADGVARLRFIELQVPPGEAEDFSG